MSRSRIFLIISAVLFTGWLVWLGFAVYKTRFSANPPVVISRAQLTTATHLIVADVTLDEEGLPAPNVKVVEVVRGDGLATGGEIRVQNLGSALPPGSTGFPGPGTYLIPVVGDGGSFRVAGMPRSPGYEASSPVRPAIYQWTEETRAQLRGLGVLAGGPTG